MEFLPPVILPNAPNDDYQINRRSSPIGYLKKAAKNGGLTVPRNRYAHAKSVDR